MGYNRWMNSELMAIELGTLHRSPAAFQGVEVHVKVGEKFIKLNYAADTIHDVLGKLAAKGVTHVYIHGQDMKLVTDKLQQKISKNFFYDPATTEEDKAAAAYQTTQAAKDLIRQFGIDKETLEIIKEANEHTQSLLKNAPGLYAFVKRFKSQCSEEFLKASMTNFLATMVIEQFPWRSQLIVQKTMLAGTLCDIMLNPEDFPDIAQYEEQGGALEERLKRHPIACRDLLLKRKELIPMETLTIIEQHHERPDGRGFPLGLHLGRFNQLSAIFIVCQRFIDLLYKEKFDFQRRHGIIAQMQTVYSGGVFDKAMDALLAVVND